MLNRLRDLRVVSVLLYATSLPLVAITLNGQLEEHVRGWLMLAAGWMGLLFLQPAWLANVSYLLTFALWKETGISWFFAVATCLLAAASPLLKTVPLESNPVVTWRAGSLVWAAAIVVMMIARATRSNIPLQADYER